MKQKHTCIRNYYLRCYRIFLHNKNSSTCCIVLVVSGQYLIKNDRRSRNDTVFYKTITEVLTTSATENSSGQTLTYWFLWTLDTRKIYDLVLDANNSILSLDACMTSGEICLWKRSSRRHTPPQSYSSKDKDFSLKREDTKFIFIYQNLTFSPRIVHESI